MNTQQLIAYVKKQTGREIEQPNISKYIRMGWLQARRNYLFGTDYFENEYSIEAANSFIAYLRALSIPEAREQLSNEIGRGVSRPRLIALCEAYKDKCLKHKREWRIPPEQLPFFADVIRDQLAQEADTTVSIETGQALINALISMGHTQKDMATYGGVDTTYISHIKSGNRPMTHALHDKLMKMLEE